MNDVVSESGREVRGWCEKVRWARSACAVALSVLVGGAGCAAVFPEIATPIRDVPADYQLDPPPPDDLLFLHVAAADIPSRTRDGREWDEVGGKAPDPFVIVFAEDEELFRTDVQRNTLRPIWKEKPDVNYRIPPRTLLRLELWDRNSMRHRSICQEAFRDVHEDVFSGGRMVTCSSGARIKLDVERAKPKMGIGMKYELRNRAIYVTRVYPESPAARAELVAGQQILSIEGRPVAELDEGEAKSLINANARTGVTLTVLEAGGATSTVTLKDGPIYPVKGAGLTLD